MNVISHEDMLNEIVGIKGSQERINYEMEVKEQVELFNKGELDERPAELKEAIFNRLFEIAEISKYTPAERQDYEESLKNFRDWYSCLTTAEKKGREEGRAEGREESKMEIARNMKNDGMPVDVIVKYTGITEDEINNL